MANVDTPMGFQPRRHISGGSRFGTNAYPLASAYATNLFTGDAVVLTSGKIAVASAASAGLLGVFAGCQYRDANGATVFSPYWPASTVTLNSEDAKAFVWDDPGIIYKAQCESGVDFVLATHNLSLADIILTHAGSTITGRSGMELTPGTSGDEQFLILQLIDEPGNAVGTHAKVECKLKDARTSSTYSA